MYSYKLYNNMRFVNHKYTLLLARKLNISFATVDIWMFITIQI